MSEKNPCKELASFCVSLSDVVYVNEININDMTLKEKYAFERGLVEILAAFYAATGKERERRVMVEFLGADTFLLPPMDSEKMKNIKIEMED